MAAVTAPIGDVPAVGGAPARTVALPKLLAGHRWDAAGITSIYLVLLVAIPSNLVFGPLGAAGTPAGLFGLGLLVWWFLARLVPGLGVSTGWQPIRIAVYLFGASIMASYASAATQPLIGEEIRAADRGILAIAALAGVALLVADGVDRQDRLDTLLRRMMYGGAFLGLVGCLQFFVGYDISKFFHLPGLRVNQPHPYFFPGNFRRVAGTASHPIEFGVVLAMLLPIALHHVAYGEGKIVRHAKICLLIIGLAIPMSLSRSAFLGLFTGGIVLFSSWSWARRRQAMIVVPCFMAAMKLVIPGLLGTIKSLFLNLRSDNSIKGRTDDYAVVGRFIAQNPLIGRGFGTFLPDRYIVLDNQYLGTIIELGYVGLSVLLLLFLIGIFTARGARRRSTDEKARYLAQSLAASVVIAMTGFFTFDAMGFPMVMGMLFLVLGAIGALWRLSREEQARA